MFAQVMLLWAMVLLEAVAFGSLTLTLGYSLWIGAAATAALFWQPRLVNHQRARLAALGVLGVIFVVKFVAAPYMPERMPTFALFPLAHVVAQFCLAWQVMHLALRAAGQPLSPWIPVGGVVVLICAADVQATPRQLIVYQSAVLGFAALTAGFYGTASRKTPYRQRSRWRGALLAGVVGATALSGYAGSRTLRHYWYDLDRYFTRLISPHNPISVTGFSRQTRLGSVAHRSTLGENIIALRVFAAESPGYLRGAAYGDYVRHEWQNRSGSTAARTVARQPGESREAEVFLIEETPCDSPRELTIWAEGEQSDPLFMPLGTCVITAKLPALNVDEHDCANAPDWPAPREYRVQVPTVATLAPAAFAPATADYLDRMLGIPDFFDQRIRDLAASVFAGCQTPEAKLRAVEQYFHANYEYRLGIDVPQHVDPLTYFLTEKPPAHCEYFASGATVLLRMAGVPCRYVTGFVAVERNDVGDYWIARNRDAHAWAEAYVPGSGWTIVEATPGSGVPSRVKRFQFAHVWDDLLVRLRTIWAYLRQGDWRGMAAALLQTLSMLVTTLPGLVVSGVLVVWGLRIAWREFQLRERQLPDRRYTEIQRLRERLDRRLRRLLIEREPGETLHQFAARLQRLAEQTPQLAPTSGWYLQYAACRYGGAVEPAAVERLERDLAQLETGDPGYSLARS